MTVFFLLRHAAHDNVGGYLAGRMPGVRLGEAGRAQARRLGERMKRERFAAIHTSPRERTQETAEAVALASSIAQVEVAPELDEIDFGDAWSGKDFETLNKDGRWRRWNQVRSLTRTPGGETMLDVQHRALGLMERLAAQYASATLVLVTHADVVKAIISHVLGLPVDAWNRFDIDPASVSSIVSEEWGARVLTLNEAVA